MTPQNDRTSSDDGIQSSTCKEDNKSIASKSKNDGRNATTDCGAADQDEDPSNMSQNRWYSSGRKRHFRRCNNEIKKGFTCPYSNCGKNYGSEGSLNLHMKIKHAAGSKTEREKIAREIVLAVRAGIDLTKEQIAHLPYLPPGLIEQSAQELGFLNELLHHSAYS